MPTVRDLSLVLSLAVAASGCVHRAAFVTEPPGATIESEDLFVRGLSIEARTGLPSTHRLRVHAPGYVDREFVLEKRYRADLSLLLVLAGLVPYLFTARLDESYEFRLDRRPAGEK